MASTFVDTVGLKIEILVGIDLTAATVTYEFQQPDVTSFSKAATIDDVAGGITSYVTVAADLDQVGDYKINPKVVIGSDTYWGATQTLTVKALYA